MLHPTFRPPTHPNQPASPIPPIPCPPCAAQGTLLRTALALGWQGVLLLDMGPGNKCCDPFNDKALRAGRGAAFKLPMAEGSMQVGAVGVS